MPNTSIAIVHGDSADRRAWYSIPFRVTIASYDQIRSDFLIDPPETSFDVVVLDEAQRLKDSMSATTVAVQRISRRRLWMLSGTPLENRTADLETLVRLMGQSSLSDRPSRSELHEALQGRFLRRRKLDVLPELPERLDQELPITLLPNQRRAYDETWQHEHSRYNPARISTMLSSISRLKQLCNYDPESQESAKLDALRDIVDTVRAEDGKLLVFSQYVTTLKWLQTQLELKAYLYHGGMATPERDEALQNFARASEPVVLLVSLRAGGVGLNIPTATHVVIFDRWWNPAVEEQAIARADRLGRATPLTVFRFLSVGTVEESIKELMYKKRLLFEDYVEQAPNPARVDADVLRRILQSDPRQVT